jgi:hypothetical protein
MTMTYLHSAQAANYLGIERGELDEKIWKGEFIKPDTVTANKRKLWSLSRLELVHQEMHPGPAVIRNADEAAALITRIRRVAELVRAYGEYRDDENRVSGIHATVPAELHVIAARLENEVRSLLYDEHMSTHAAKNASGTSNVSTNTESGPSWTPLTITFGTVDSLMPPAGMDVYARVVNLADAQNQLDDIIVALPTALTSPGTRLAMLALGAERDNIRDHILDPRSGLAAAGTTQ